MKVFRKDVSDAEVQALMRSRIEELSRFVVPRADSNRPAGHVRKTTGKRSAGRTDNEMIELSPDMLEYMRSILEHANDTVTDRAKRLGHSHDKSNRIKKSLIEKGLITQLNLNFGGYTHGRVSLLQLTEEGYRSLGKSPPQNVSRRCSPEHLWWQRNIVAYYKSVGVQASMEMTLDGRHYADIGLVWNGQRVAVEVTMSVSNVIENVSGDLRSGFDQCLVGCKNSKQRQAVEGRLNEGLSAEERVRTKIILLSDFTFVREIFGRRPRCQDAAQGS